jgi:hypothetical protein
MRFLVIAAVLMLANCASAPDPNTPFVAAAAAPEGHANLYVYRHRAPPYIYRAEIYVDDVLVVKLPERGYSVIPVRQGQRIVRIESFDWPDVSFKVDVNDSSDIFVRFTGEANRLQGLTMELVAAAYLVEAPMGQAELSACCRFVEPIAAPP